MEGDGLMLPEVKEIFRKYEEFVQQMDGVFESVREQYDACVKCKLGCSDCCHALFDLTLVEAMYLNHHFLEKVAETERDGILEASNKADRHVYQLKKKAFKAVEAKEKSEEQVLLEMAAERVRCPLLNKEDRCDLYAYRPITCRLYGIPTSIGGRGHTCGLSDFKEGESYPSVNLDIVHQRLHQLSQELVAALRSTHIRMGEVLMPLSMALLTVFNDDYLGVKTSAENEENTEG
jgi:Fe-S-cluster containining protein